MQVAEYAAHDATSLAALIRRGEVSAKEVHAAALEAIGTVNREINAITNGPWDRPLPYAEDGWFAGVPFVLKDLGASAAGIPGRKGSRLAGAGIVREEDTFLARRFREAGLAISALTTTPELGNNITTEAVIHGPTCNPWDLSRSAGGSSGGTGALVAAGGVPTGHATDGAGSIRIPAACNGLVGLKPSRGRTTPGPDVQEMLYGFAEEFVITRTIRDCAAMLDAVAGTMPGDKFMVRPPERPWSEEVGSDPGRLRVAVHTESWSSVPVDTEVADAVERVASELEQLGHHVNRAAPDFEWEAFASTARVFASSMAAGIDRLAEASGSQPGPETLEHTTLACYEYGRRLAAVDVAHAMTTVNRFARTLGRFFTEWDLLITPTLCAPPAPLGRFDANTMLLDAEGWIRRILEATSFTPVFNWTGTPGISLPLGSTSEGLPIGVHFAAPMCEEATLFRIGSQLEEAMPWRDRRAPVHATNLIPR